MTREEKLKMLLHPEQYTDEQMNQMLDDTDITVPDAKKEWSRLEAKHHITHKPLMRWAAIFVGLLMLSGISYAAYHIIYGFDKHQQMPVTETQMVTQPNTASVQVAQADTTQLTNPIVYENAELGTILNDIAIQYQVEIVYKKEASKHIRLYFTLDKTANIDKIIDTFNNFERIHITNENQKLIVE